MHRSSSRRCNNVKDTCSLKNNADQDNGDSSDEGSAGMRGESMCGWKGKHAGDHMIAVKSASHMWGIHLIVCVTLG